jgi:hypothetical protein
MPMRFALFGLALAGGLLAAGCSSEEEEPAPPVPGVVLLSPTGGEIWGGPRDVEWAAWNCDGGSAEVAVSSDSGATWTTASSGLPAGGPFAWDTTGEADGSQFRVRVRCTDAAGRVTAWSASGADVSVDNTLPAAALVSPAGGELWCGVRAVTWATADLHPSTADLELSSDSGATWASLRASVPDSGSWMWNTASAADGSAYRVRVRARDAAGNVSAWSASAADFAVDNAPPSITLLSPSGGEVWTGVRSAVWTSTDAHKSTVDVQLSADAGATWNPLAAGVADSGSFAWDTGGTRAGTFFRVRVRAEDLAGNLSSWSSSAGDFTILHWNWTRRMGDTGVDRAYALALDPSGNAYAAGMFGGAVDFRADFGGGTDVKTGNNTDVFVTKVLPDGSYGWTRCIGGTGVDWADELASDAGGNLLVAGKFAGTVDFRAGWGGGTDSRTAASDDAFLTQIPSDGSYGWTRQFGGSGIDRIGALATDANGNIYIAGYWDATVNFAADFAGTDPRTTTTGPDAFVTKVLPDGSYGWTRVFGGAGTDSAFGCCTDASGNVYVSGYFSGAVDFRADWGGGTDSRTPAGSTDVFVLKVLADGSYGWVRRIGGSSGDLGYALAAAPDGTLFTAGSFQGTVDFRGEWGGSADSRTSAGGADGFVTRILPDGSYGWTRVVGGTGADDLSALALDGAGNLFAGGSFAGTVDLRSAWGGPADSRTALGASDLFLLRVNADGTYGWGMRAGDSNAEMLGGVALDAAGSVFVAGSFRGTVDFRGDWGGGSDAKSSPMSSSDAFVLRFR